MPVVYLDSVFLFNALLDYLLFLSTARLAGIPLRRRRYLLCGVLGGLYAVGRTGRRSLAVGLGTGVTLFLLLLCVGLLAYDAAGLEREGAGTLCACLCGGGLAGVLSLPRKKKRRR